MSFFDRFQPLAIGRAIQTEWPAPEYILGPLQPGDVGLISGADGLGKSYVAACAAMAAACGRADLFGGMWNVPRTAAKVIYFAVEDRLTDHGRRLQWLGRHARMFDGLHIEDEDDSVTLMPTEGERIPLVEREGKPGQYAVTPIGKEWAEHIKPYRLVVIDPLRAFHGLEESDGAGMDFFARWLVSVAMGNQQVILAVHHASQSAILDRRDDHHSGRGATDLPAACRAVWVLRALNDKEADVLDEGDDRRLWRTLVNGKASHGEESATRYLRKQEHGVLRVGRLTTAAPKEQAAPRNSYAEAKQGTNAADLIAALRASGKENRHG
ncbi:AAA family ATPase [Thiomonas delicata]|uniref:Uncharacterized protein n=1 Tax=Thiomonas delicata TaxID=364030 RepID=A0A238D6H4_THIDL|nr:AAA family ATPase [Thiomonas delicata]SBP88938.1 hypothetical protein THIARS_70558 [Thiomonas delicata]